MGFFKDFKEDASQAMKELMPQDDEVLDEEGTDEDDLVVNTLEDELDVESELSKLNGLLESVAKEEAKGFHYEYTRRRIKTPKNEAGFFDDRERNRPENDTRELFRKTPVPFRFPMSASFTSAPFRLRRRSRPCGP